MNIPNPTVGGLSPPSPPYPVRAFPMFTVDLRPAKDALSARIAALRSELMQVVTMQHRDELDKQVSRHAKPNILWVLGREPLLVL